MNRQDKIEALTNLIIECNYGDIISHQDISACIQEVRSTAKYNGIINAAQKRLLEYSRMVENIRGVGYRVVSPDDYTKVSIKHVFSGSRRISRGCQILEYAPVKDMTQEGVQNYNLVADRMRILKASVAGAKVEIRMLGNQRRHPFTQIENR